MASKGIYLLNQNYAINVTNGKSITDNTLPAPYNKGINFLLGSANNNLIFYGKTGLISSTAAIGAYRDGKIINIITDNELNKDGYGDLQFLTSGHKVVLKVIYPNKRERYFYLNELIEVKGVDKTFEVVKIYDRHINGSEEGGWVNTYTFSLLGLYYYDVIKDRPYVLF